MGDSGLVPEQISSPAEAEVTVMQGASAWNSGGTWEEKSVFQKTEAFLKHELEGAELGPGLRVDAVESVKGEASVVYVRKKKKPGFELDLTLKWTYAPDGESLPLSHLRDLQRTRLMTRTTTMHQAQT